MEVLKKNKNTTTSVNQTKRMYTDNYYARHYTVGT